MTKEDALELIERIPYIPLLSASGCKGRIDLYKKALSKKDPLEWLKVAKSCRVRAGQGSGSIENTLESEYSRRACCRLNNLFAEALGIKEEDVESFIEGHLRGGN